MKILYYIYQICIALPILLVLTILTAIVTIVGSLLGGAHFWGYYPGKIWSQLICLFLLIPVKIEGREKLHDKTSYIFVPNHQGSFDIFLIYGFIGRNFKWMMKKSLRKLPFVGKASFEILPRTGKWIHRHRMILTIHDPIPPKGKGMENIKATMAEAYAAVESALPEQHKGMVKNEDQDR